jgi:hypothetical protein
MQKRMMALPATTAGPHNTPLLLAVYDHSSSVSTSSQHATTDQEACTSFDNIEMQDISAAASTASPPANYVSIPCASQQRQLTFLFPNSLAHVLGLVSRLPRNLLCRLEPQPLPPSLPQAPLHWKDSLRTVQCRHKLQTLPPLSSQTLLLRQLLLKSLPLRHPRAVSVLA